MPARLKKRQSFKAVAGGVRAVARSPQTVPADAGHTAGAAGKAKRPHQRRDDLFTLQAAPAPDTSAEPRVGFTVTKKLGNAVVRNRIKRRLRAATSDTADAFRRGTDYVVVARRNALGVPYEMLCQGLVTAARAAHEKLQRQDATQSAGSPPEGPVRTL